MRGLVFTQEEEETCQRMAPEPPLMTSAGPFFPATRCHFLSAFGEFFLLDLPLFPHPALLKGSPLSF